MAEDYDQLCLKSPPKDDVLTAQIQCSQREHVEFIVSAKQERGIVIAVSAVKWSYPARASLWHLQGLERKSKLMQSMNVKPFLIDQELDRTFCKQHGIMVGVPVLQAWYQSDPLFFSRTGRKTKQIVHGPFNFEQYQKLIKHINRAINIATKTQSPLQPIDVDFLDER